MKNEIRKAISFTKASKTIKYISTNLIKEMQDVHWKLKKIVERN